jgi:hypothetical protein
MGRQEMAEMQFQKHTVHAQPVYEGLREEEVGGRGCVEEVRGGVGVRMGKGHQVAVGIDS